MEKEFEVTVSFEVVARSEDEAKDVMENLISEFQKNHKHRIKKTKLDGVWEIPF